MHMHAVAQKLNRVKPYALWLEIVDAQGEMSQRLTSMIFRSLSYSYNSLMHELYNWGNVAVLLLFLNQTLNYGLEQGILNIHR